MLLSVIIPFYHVERYIARCLEAAAQLPARECEIILVDDCGEDASADIAADFCARYANMRVVRRAQNGGLSAARNTGLAQASGEYIWFVDSDDEPLPNALYMMARQAKEMALDVAKGRFVFFDDETGTQTPGPAIPATDVMPGGALFASQCRADLYEPMVWQCLYRRVYLEQIGLTMAEGLLFEDELFQAPALIHAPRAAAFAHEILRYRQRAGSIMGSFAKNSRWCDSYLQVCRRLDALAKTLEPGEARAALARRVGQIALSVCKNIPAYRLPPAVAREAVAFAARHKRELSGYALRSGDRLVVAQGRMMRLSVRLFIALYARRG